MESVMPSVGRMPALIHHFLEDSARRSPGKTAVVHGPQSADYSRINGRANRLARSLIEAGIRPADRIVLLSENSVEYVIAYFGILKAGAIAVSLNIDIKPEGLDELLRELKPRILVYSFKAEKTVQALDFSLYGIARSLVIGSPGAVERVE